MPPRRPSWPTFTHRADLYARRVLGDKKAGAPIVAGPLVRLACERHLADRVAAATKAVHPGGWRFDTERADVCISFFEEVLFLPDTLDGDGQPVPFLLAPPLVFIIGSVMGWVGADGYRRFREAYVEGGKGCGKTPLAAGLGLFGLTSDGEQGAEIYSAAVTREQARTMFRDAERMVACSPELKTIVRATVNNLACQSTLSFFRPYSRDEGTRSGPRPHMALIDEVHEHPTPYVINLLKAGFKARRQPLAFEITNAGFDRTSVCWEHHEHAVSVLNGRVEDDRLFAFVCNLDEGDDPFTDESCWVKTNPLLPIIPSMEYLRRQVQNAGNIPSELNGVKRLNFCQWTDTRERAINMAQWDTCSSEPVSPFELAGAECYAGLDLGMSDDLSAFVRVWELAEGRIAVSARFWLPEAAMEKRPNRPYDAWRRSGNLEITEGSMTDFDLIEDAVYEECAITPVLEMAYDERFARHIAQHLDDKGVLTVKLQQGFALNLASKRLGELVAGGLLCHGGNPLLSWMAGNLVFRHGRNKEIRPDKDAPGEKMDGMVALIMALDRMMAAPDVQPAPEVRTLRW